MFFFGFNFDLKFTLILSRREVCLELIFDVPLHSRKDPSKKPKVRRGFENSPRNIVFKFHHLEKLKIHFSKRGKNIFNFIFFDVIENSVC